MRVLKRVGPLLAATLSLMVGGCASRITNLTPSVMPREATGLYPFEAEWTSNQRARQLRQQDIRGYLVLDQKLHPMERVSKMADRWETAVPLPQGKNPVFYYFKWDYGTAGFPNTEVNSIRSREYRLEVVDGPLRP